MTAHDWYRPPIPAAPMVCAACGANVCDMDAPAECPGDEYEPHPDQLEALNSATTGAERHAAAWQQHEETHR